MHVAAVLILLALLIGPRLANAEAGEWPFHLEPTVADFQVLGEAWGVLAILDTGPGCMVAENVDFRLHPNVTEPKNLLGVRFALAAPNGPEDWRMIAKSDVRPVALTLKPHETSTVQNIVGCFCVPNELQWGEYWLLMEMIMEDQDHPYVTTYAVTLPQYQQLMSEPNKAFERTQEGAGDCASSDVSAAQR